MDTLLKTTLIILFSLTSHVQSAFGKLLQSSPIEYNRLVNSNKNISTHTKKNTQVTSNSITGTQPDQSRKKFSSYIYYIASTCVVVCIGIFAKKKRKKISEEESNPQIIDIKDNKKESNIQISDLTQQRILKHFNTFEENREYLNPKISATVLANQFETNTKYIACILKKTYNKDFSTYINELRINYITQLLDEDPKYRQYKISYLAEISGYSSHSKFTSVFKKIKSCSPSAYIYQLGQKENN